MKAVRKGLAAAANALAGPGGGPDVQLTWADDDRLLVRHHPRARVWAEPRVSGVDAVYAPI